MKRINWLLIGLLLMGFLAGCAAEPEQGEEKKNRVAVEGYKVHEQEIRDSFTEIGDLQASRRVTVKARTEGELLKVGFRDGQLVEEGQILFEIDDEVLQQEVEASRQALEEAKVNLKNNRKKYQRKKSLFRRGLAPRQVYDDARALFKSSIARVSRLEAQLESARERLDDAYLKAPFDGVIGENMVDTGELVSVEDPLAIVHRINPMEVRFSVPEKYAYRVKRGLPLKVESEIYAEKIFDGKITFINPEINQQTRKLLLKGEINNGSGKLKPGGFVRATVIFDTRVNPVVPARALVAGREGYSVYRIEEWLAHRQQVLVGRRESGRVEILRGVHSGDLIVERGHESLSDNAPVKVLNDIQGNEK